MEEEEEEQGQKLGSSGREQRRSPKSEAKAASWKRHRCRNRARAHYARRCRRGKSSVSAREIFDYEDSSFPPAVGTVTLNWA